MEEMGRKEAAEKLKLSPPTAPPPPPPAADFNLKGFLLLLAPAPKLCCSPAPVRKEASPRLLSSSQVLKTSNNFHPILSPSLFCSTQMKEARMYSICDFGRISIVELGNENYPKTLRRTRKHKEQKDGCKRGDDWRVPNLFPFFRRKVSKQEQREKAGGERERRHQKVCFLHPQLCFPGTKK